MARYVDGGHQGPVDWLEVAARLVAEAAEQTPKLYSIKQASELLGYDPEDVEDAARQRHLNVMRLGQGLWRIAPADLLRFYLARVTHDPRVWALRVENERLRLALEKACAGSIRPLPPTTRRAVQARDGRKCRYCGRRIGKREPLHIDHVLPRSRGGADTLDNLVVACVACNTRKGALTPKEAKMPLLYAPGDLVA